MPGSEPLVMRFAAGTVKHFGLHMYSTPVPALAEMVANAWDADSEQVRIDIPLGTPLTPDATITVRDTGHGMAREDCRLKYLLVGRDRRRADKTDLSPKGRPVMGHKGLGKFAPFGIAHVVEVRTVKDGLRTTFRMDYRDMIPSQDDEEAGEAFVSQYEPEEIEGEAPTDEPNGTTIRLSELRLTRAISADVFMSAMARRFTCIGTGFKLYVNGQALSPFSVNLDLRIPSGEDEWEHTKLEDGNDIDWWVGFTKTPVPIPELRGVSVVVREKLAQVPFSFGVSGTTGQAGLAYMVGEVKANYIDAADDKVATDRSSLLWEDPLAEPLYNWGEARIKEWLRTWVERRAQLRLTRLANERPVLNGMLEAAERFPDAEARQLRAIINRLATLMEDDGELEWAVTQVEGAFEDRRFMDIVHRLAALEDQPLADVVALFHEYDVFASIRIAQLVVAKLNVIGALKSLIDRRVPEKPDLQDFIAEHPWLLNSEWELHRHETAIDTILAQELKVDPLKDGEGRLRVDFFCLGLGREVVIVELKRPGHRATLEEWNKFVQYVSILRWHYSNVTSNERRNVTGLFIASALEDTAQQQAVDANLEIYHHQGWDDVITRVDREHREQLALIGGRAKPDDPRLHRLRDIVPEEAAN